MPLTRLFLAGVILAFPLTLITLAVGWYFGVAGGRTFWFEQIVPTVVLFLVCMIVCLGCAIARDNGAPSRMMIIGIVLAALAFIGWTAFFVTEGYDARPALLSWPQVLTWPSLWSMWCALVGVLGVIKPRSRGWCVLRRWTAFTLALFAAHVCIAITLVPDYWTGENLLTIWWTTDASPLAVAYSVGRSPAGLFAIGLVALVLLMISYNEVGRMRRAAFIVATIMLATLCMLLGALFVDPHILRIPVASSGYAYNYTRAPAFEIWETATMVSGMALGTAAAVMVLLTCGLAMLDRLANKPVYTLEARTFSLTCPRCTHVQTALVGGHICTSCGLIVRVEVVG